MLQTLTFNGPRQVNAAASFFRYESGSAGGADESIRVRADGQDLGIYWPGDSVELPDSRSMWDIIPTTPTATGTLRLGVGRVQSARLSGRVEVIDGISQSVQTIGAGASNTSVTAGRADTLVSPGSNTGGLIVRQMTLAIQAAASGTADCRFVAAPSAPSSYIGNLMPLQVAVSAAGQAVTVSNSDYKKRIPPGWGIYLYYSVQTAAAQSISYALSYEAL